MLLILFLTFSLIFTEPSIEEVHKSYSSYYRNVMSSIFSMDHNIRRQFGDNLLKSPLGSHNDYLSMSKDELYNFVTDSPLLHQKKRLSFFEPYTSSNTTLFYDVKIHPRSVNLDLFLEGYENDVNCIKESNTIIVKLPKNGRDRGQMMNEWGKGLRLYTSKCLDGTNDEMIYSIVKESFGFFLNEGGMYVKFFVRPVKIFAFFLEMEVDFQHSPGNEEQMRRWTIDENIKLLGFNQNYDEQRDAAKEVLDIYSSGSNLYVGCSNCYFVFNSNLKFYLQTGFNWKFWKEWKVVKEFEVKLSGYLKLNIETLAKFSYAKAGNVEKKLFDKDLPEITFFLSAFPVHITPNIAMSVGLDYDFKVNAEVCHLFYYNTQASMGYKYPNVGATKSFGQELYLGKPKVKATGRLILTPYIKPKLTLKLYSIIPISFTPKPYMIVDIDAQIDKLYADITMNWGVDLFIDVGELDFLGQKFDLDGNLPYRHTWNVVSKRALNCKYPFCLNGNRVGLDSNWNFYNKKNDRPSNNRRGLLMGTQGTPLLPEELQCIETPIYELLENEFNIPKIGFMTEDIPIEGNQLHYFELIDANLYASNIPFPGKKVMFCFAAEKDLTIAIRDSDITVGQWGDEKTFSSFQCHDNNEKGVEFYVEESNNVQNKYSFSIFYSTTLDSTSLNTLSPTITLNNKQYTEIVYDNIVNYQGFVVSILNVNKFISVKVGLEGYDSQNSLVYTLNEVFISHNAKEEFIVNTMIDDISSIDHWKVFLYPISLEADVQFQIGLTGFDKVEINKRSVVNGDVNRLLWRVDETSLSFDVVQYNIHIETTNTVEISIYSFEHTRLLGISKQVITDTADISVNKIEKNQFMGNNTYFVISVNPAHINDLVAIKVESLLEVISGTPEVFVFDRAQFFQYSLPSNTEADLYIKTFSGCEYTLKVYEIPISTGIWFHIYDETAFTAGEHMVKIPTCTSDKDYVVKFNSANFNEDCQFSFLLYDSKTVNAKKMITLSTQNLIYVKHQTNKYTSFTIDGLASDINLYACHDCCLFPTSTVNPKFPSHNNFIKRISNNETFYLHTQGDDYFFGLLSLYQEESFTIKIGSFEAATISVEFEYAAAVDDENTLNSIVKNGMNITFTINSPLHGFARLYLPNAETEMLLIVDLIKSIKGKRFWKQIIEYFEKKFDTLKEDYDVFQTFIDFYDHVILYTDDSGENIFKVKVLIPPLDTLKIPIYSFSETLYVEKVPAYLFQTFDDRYTIVNQGNSFVVSHKSTTLIILSIIAGCLVIVLCAALITICGCAFCSKFRNTLKGFKDISVEKELDDNIKEIETI